MRNAAALVVLLLCALPAASQPSSPMARYNAIADRMYQLERCNEMTQERWEWIERRRVQAMRALNWDEVLTQEHDKLLIADFDNRYRAGIDKDRCDELARAIDRDRKSTAKGTAAKKRP